MVFRLDTRPDAQEIRRPQLGGHASGSSQEYCCGQREASSDEDAVPADGVLVRALNEHCQGRQVPGTVKD